jgi:hypothetical protein
MFATYATPTTDSVTEPEALLTRYKEYQDVFEKKNADMLPQHRPYNWATDLQDGTQPPFRPIYNLSQNELATLQDYFDENLAKNFIWHSTPILFVKKKKMVHFGCVSTIVALTKLQEKISIHCCLFYGLLDQLGQTKVYTKIDLQGAYNLVQIKISNEWKIAFRTRYEHFEYNIMHFGLINTAAIFNTWWMISSVNS